jgi:hypothetical protein
VHIFKSFSAAKGLQGDFLKSLVTETCKINGGDISTDDADNLSADDTMYIIEVLSTQLSKLDF